MSADGGLTSSTKGGTVDNERSPIRTQGTVQLKTASLTDSVANDQENENRLMWVRAVESAVKKWSKATTGTSGEFNSSRPNNCRPNRNP